MLDTMMSYAATHNMFVQTAGAKCDMKLLVRHNSPDAAALGGSNSSDAAALGGSSSCDVNICLCKPFEFETNIAASKDCRMPMHTLQLLRPGRAVAPGNGTRDAGSPPAFWAAQHTSGSLERLHPFHWHWASSAGL